MTHILLIRHAQSANNSLPEHQRVPDPALTELGVRQAALTAAALRSVPLTHLYSSPFLRSLETSRPIAESLSLKVSIRNDIFEQGGCYSGWIDGQEVGEPGMCCNQLAERYPSWEVDPRIGSSGWWERRDYETLEQASQRAVIVAQWLKNELVPLGGVHALVIHADFKRLLVAAMLEERAEFVMPILGPLNNVGITRLQWQIDRWQLNSFNATTHLPADFVT
jgi:2,3-bisphosphoglycerate-dependent phosphoglycerate mutase